ncbi:peroxisome biogenesis factor 10 [Lignoscripta atroalba]|nr:peroxisome biogenesis factor 10 [Lignoscripta atroalba]
MASPSDLNDHVHLHDATETTNPSYQYPFASAPDIIRSNQKDTHFQGILLEHFSTILRNLYGARFIHTYASEARTFTELLYMGLTTLVGNRTLGEEYCDIIQIEDSTLRLPSVLRRAGYILSTVLLPYALNKLLPAFRNRVRLKLESNLRRLSRNGKAWSSLPFSARMQSYMHVNLSTITSPSLVYALSLSVFYFTGSYYHLGKRIFGLRYIFTKTPAPSDQRVGYEVLGVLLVLQMVVQGWLHLHNTLQDAELALVNPSVATAATTVVDGEVETGLDLHMHNDTNVLLFESAIPSHRVGKSGVEKSAHTPILDKPRYGLKDGNIMGWISGKQQRKCTLCLEELKDPSVTTCGHVFCWICIVDWIREKPECPLCRQGIMTQHVLPLRG